MSLLARSSAPLRQVARSRLAAPSRGVHSEYKHVPFEYNNKPVFATKLAAFLLTGFSIPFIAAWYQRKKAGGA